MILASKTIYSNPGIDLVEFFHQISPERQYDAIYTIAYFYQKYKGIQHLDKADFEQVYDTLGYSADRPSQMSKSLNDAKKKYPRYFRSINRGKYVLTKSGMDYVESLLP